MADYIQPNGSNVARKNKIVLKIDGIELGVISSFKHNESRNVEQYFTYGGDSENPKCLIPELVKTKKINVTGLVLFKKDLLNVMKKSDEDMEIDTLVKQLTPFDIEEYNTDVQTGTTKVTIYHDCLFDDQDIDTALDTGSLAVVATATITFRKKDTKYSD